jgi:hypothetical protein
MTICLSLSRSPSIDLILAYKSVIWSSFSHSANSLLTVASSISSSLILLSLASICCWSWIVVLSIVLMYWSLSLASLWSVLIVFLSWKMVDYFVVMFSWISTILDLIVEISKSLVLMVSW